MKTTKMIMAALLFMGSLGFAACSSEDTPNVPEINETKSFNELNSDLAAVNDNGIVVAGVNTPIFTDGGDRLGVVVSEAGSAKKFMIWNHGTYLEVPQSGAMLDFVIEDEYAKSPMSVLSVSYQYDLDMTLFEDRHDSNQLAVWNKLAETNKTEEIDLTTDYDKDIYGTVNYVNNDNGVQSFGYTVPRNDTGKPRFITLTVLHEYAGVYQAEDPLMVKYGIVLLQR